MVVVSVVLSVSSVSHSTELWDLKGIVTTLKFVAIWEEVQVVWGHQRLVAGLWSGDSLMGLRP